VYLPLLPCFQAVSHNSNFGRIKKYATPPATVSNSPSVVPSSNLSKSPSILADSHPTLTPNILRQGMSNISLPAEYYLPRVAISDPQVNTALQKFPVHSNRGPFTASKYDINAEHDKKDMISFQNETYRHPTSQPLRPDTQSIHYITVISNQPSPTALPASLEFHPPAADSGSKITATVDHGSLPEQKIFPGIVHERARRGSVITVSATGLKETRDCTEQKVDTNENDTAMSANDR
jgi:hypothetical protein